MTTAPAIHARTLDGPDRHLVFLHGWGLNAASLVPLAELLGAVGTRHVLDLPGFGASEDPPDTWDTLDYTKRVATWMDEQGITKADFVGHSFGGRLSIRMGCHFPEKVRSITLIGGAGLRPKRSLKARIRVKFSLWLGKLARMLPGFLRDPILRWRAGKFGSADWKAVKEVLRPVLSRVVAEDLAPEAEKVRAPTLLMYGKEDTETPPDMGERYHALIPGSELVLLDGQGHHPFLGGGVHLLATRLKRFYEKVPA